jgi:hypothetical protein
MAKKKVLTKKKDRTKFLEVGDVFMLEKGHLVEMLVPERFRFSNRQLSMRKTRTIVEVGRVLLPSGNLSVAEIADTVVKQILYDGGMEADRNEVIAFLESVRDKQDKKLPQEYDTSEYVGEYVVERAEKADDDSDIVAYRVIARKLKGGDYDKDGLVVAFHQSGIFMDMVENVKVIRRMDVPECSR